MAKFRHFSYEQGAMIPVNFNDQIVEGTIEYTINWLVDNKIDLTVFENRYRNDRCKRYDNLKAIRYTDND